MKNLKQFLNESVEWVGCMWNSNHAIPLQDNRYIPFDIEKVKEHMKSLTTNYKWNTNLQQFVSVESDLKSEADIEKMIKSKFKTNVNYRKFNYEDFTAMVKEIYDGFVNDYDYRNGEENKTKGHPFIKNDDGEILKLEDWLKEPCDYDLDMYGKPFSYRGNARTWKEYLEKEWEDIQKNKENTIEYLTQYAKGYLKNTVDKSENDLRNIKLEKKIRFGSVTAGAGRQTRHEVGYIKIGEGSKEGKTLILEYTENESEAIKLETLGDLLDLLYKYKKCKLMTPAGVLNTKYANAIVLYPLDNKLEKAIVGIIKFR